MTENTAETDETFVANEEGVAYTSESAPSADAPLKPGHHRPRRRHRPPQGGRRPRPPRPRHRQLARQRTHPRLLLPQQAAPAGRQRALRDDRAGVGRFDVIARIHGGGITGQAGALRLGVARALNAIDTEANRPSLKKAGLLTRDARVIERKKAGLKKARKAPQYSKR